jgi:hypothetical protein
MELTDLYPEARVFHERQGYGAVLQLTNLSVTIFWEEPWPASNTRQVTHDAAFAKELVLVPAKMDGSWPELRASDA